MKLLLINTLYYPHLVGGAERSVQTLAESLLNMGHEVTVISSYSEGKPKQDWVRGVKVYYLPLKNLYWPYSKRDPSTVQKLLWHAIDSYNPVMRREVARILDLEQADIVHTNNLSGFSAALWQDVKKRNLPLVHTLRDYYFLCPKATMYKRNNCYRQCLDCKLLSIPKVAQVDLVDSIVGISEFILERHLDFGYFNRAFKSVIPNAYKAKGRILHSPSDKLRFGFLGRLAPTKGIELLLHTCQTLPQQSFELLLGGEGDKAYVAHLKQSYPLPNSSYLGHVDSANFFSQIDVLVTPSLWHEPMGRIVIEAFAYGVPVIGSNRGGLPGLIDEGSTGFIFDPDETKALQNALEHFLQKPKLARQMQAACLTKAQTFLPSQMTNAYLEVYRNALKPVS